MANSPNSNNLNWFSTIAKYIIFIIFSSVLAYKILITPIQLNIDLLAFLFLTLALFSIGFSALFYFKATETSNAFYDNSFKYTKEIAELLVRIESGFDERLNHLDENYTRLSGMPGDEVGEVQEKLDMEKEDLKLKIIERENLINDLANKTNLAGKKKEEFFVELDKRDRDLMVARDEIDLLQKEVDKLRGNNNSFNNDMLLKGVTEYLSRRVLPRLDLPSNRRLSPSLISKGWKLYRDKISNEFIQDMKVLRLVDFNGDLTSNGIHLINSLLRDTPNK